MEIKNKTALITGASRGMGREFAKLHASKGGNLVIISRDKTKLEEVKKELEIKYNVTVKVIVKDLSILSSAIEIYEELKRENITIDYLINDAGFGGRGLFHERTLENDLSMIQVNVIALTNLTKLFLPDFIKRNEGKILNVSSTAALMPGPLQAVYYATKAYVTSLGNAIYEEIKNTNVTITTLMPGAVNTGFAKTANMDKTTLFAKPVNPEDVVKVAYDGMLKGKMNVIAGVNPVQRLFVKLTPFIPKKFMLKQIYNMQLEK